MIEFFVRRPVTTIMFVMVFVVLGIYSFANIQIEKTPKIDFPMVTVTAVYPGATPLEVETLVVKKIEDAIAEISEIDNIESMSYNNFGFIFTQFNLLADVNVKLVEVKDKVEAILNELPDNMEKPLIEKFDPLMSPVLDLILTSDKHNSKDLYEYADKTLKNKLSRIEGVAKVDVYGGRIRRINVKLDPMLMKERYITITDITGALRKKNINIPSGELERRYNALSVRFVGEFQNVDEIKNMWLTSSEGSKFKLKEIAVVEDSFKKIESIARYNGQEVVGLSLNKASDGNAAAVSDEALKRLSGFQKALPKGMKLELASDSTDFLKRETYNTEINILFGILLTVLILYMFTGKSKITLIATVIIPTSLISTFWPMSASGFSINFLTLLAIATSLGTLIANAIVIIENVLVHLDKGKDSITAAIDGTKEVSVAVIAATGTNLVVFMPIAMMGEIIGMFMRSFGLTVVYTTIFSLIASFSLTPMMCGFFLKTKPKRKPKERNFLMKLLHWPHKHTDIAVKKLKKEYKIIFDLMFTYPKLTLLFTFLMFLSLKAVLPFIDNEFMPSSDENRVGISIIMPQGSTIERTLNTVKQIEKKIEKIPEKLSYLSNIGGNGVENASITMDLVPSKDRERTDTAIMNELMVFTSKIPDAEINIFRSNRGPGGGRGDVSINIWGEDYSEMVNISLEMRKIMQKTGFFKSVSSSHKLPRKEISFTPDEAKLIEYGITADKVGKAMRASIYGDDSNKYKEKGEEYDINVQLDNRYAESFSDISEISMRSKKGLIPVSLLGEIENSKSLPTIRHRDKKRIIRLEGFLAKGRLGSVTKILNAEFDKLNFAEGYGYTYMGMSEMQRKSGKEMGKAFSLAIILTYMLLAAILNSFKHPIAILLVIATSFIGVFYILFFLGYSNSMIGMLSMVMLIGLAVNNAILLVDYALMKINEGIETKEALWLAADKKINAILMTTIAVILGLLPQFASISEMKKSMSAVMIGGMIGSIFFTFIFVPVVFMYLEKMSFKTLKRFVPFLK
ncbi:MAG: efflux RND transporter permease subunit [Elusimicrobiota bacterium]|nr:efflux RND transporter permease subunit [Elusimicrobiota bacterium]